MMKREKELEKYLLKLCEKRKILCRKLAFPQRSGAPDRLLLKDGHVVFIELKTEVGRVSKLQAMEISSLLSHGGRVYVAANETQINDILDFEFGVWF